MAKVSKAQQKAVQRYVSKAYDRIVLTMPKGERAIIRSAAENAETSVNAFILEAVRERIGGRE